MLTKNINFPFSKELKIIFNLVNKDDSLRIVGGSVRDFLINKEISDVDLACKFKPEETKKILEKNNIKVIETGIKHGTITAIINNKSFEITTLRKDVENYGRKAKVEFIDSFLEDAKRRDFTINAMSIDGNGKLFDYFNGFEDLKNKKVVFIGDAKARITEDYLRILRFFRFSCYYSNKIDEEALKNIVELKDNIVSLSSHRIRSELIKIISCNNNERLLETLDAMQKNSILEKILLSNNFDLTFLKNLLTFADSLSEKEEPLLKFSALIYSHKEKNLEITKHLDFSNKEKKFISTILDLSNKINLEITDVELFKLLFDFDKELLVAALKINIALNFAQNKPILNKFLEIKNLINRTDLPKFILDGNDLKAANIEPKNIGKILKELRDFWIENNFKPSKKDLMNKTAK